MRNMTFACVSAALLIGMAAPALGSPASGTVMMRATATYNDGSSADRLYRVSPADLDGDGWLRVRCDDGVATAAYYYHEVKSPRDAATGQASGKRMHKPFTIVKEWGAKSGGGGGGATGADDGVTSAGDGVIGARASWDLATGKGARGVGTKTGYNVKSVEGTGARAKTSAMDDWHQVTLMKGSPNLCG